MKFYFETYGCSLNFADTNIMKSILSGNFNSEFVHNADDADVSVINTCIVKTPTENKILKRIKQLKGKKIVVAGCMAEALTNKVKKVLDGTVYSIVGTENIDKIADAIKGLNENRVTTFIGENKNIVNSYFTKKNFDKVIDIVPISRGCLGNCSYCITKFARRQLKSYDESAIIDQIKRSISFGAKEIWLTSEDMSCYGLDKGTNIVSLVKSVSQIEGDFFMRMGMFNPSFLKLYVSDMMNNLGENFFRFFHVPVQSGNDRVLSLMRRGYSEKEALDVFKVLRNDKRNTISTDIIVGFPTETEEEFEETLDFIKEVKPDVLNISRFWLREGTEAGNLKQFPGRVTKERSRILTKLHNQISKERNEMWVGWKGKVLVDEYHTKFVSARNSYYKPIIIYDVPEDFVGRFVDVTVTEARVHFLVGRINGKL